MKLQREKAEAHSLLELAKYERDQLAQKQASIDGSVAALLAPPPRYPSVPVVRLTSDHDVIVDLGDTHFGKLVEPQGLGLGFAYNRDIALECIAQIEAEIEQVAKMAGATQGLRYLFFFLLGDILEGHGMRPGQAWTVDMTINEQKYWACQVLSTLFDNCAAMGFQKVIVRGVVGNHGRLRSRLEDDKLVDNHEYNLYQMLEATFKHSQAPVFITPVPRYFDFIQIGEKTHLTEHGHFVKGAGSPQSVEKYLAKQAQNILGVYPDYSHFAHLHHEYIVNVGNDRLLIGNGCLDGGDDFTCNVLAKAASASQWIHLHHPTDGIYFHQSVRFSKKRGIMQPELLA